MAARGAMDSESAAAIAASYAEGCSRNVNTAAVRETSSGWYFPWLSGDHPIFGSNGIIVNKETGRVLALGSAFPVDRDLQFYDRGYQTERYDLVVLAVRNAHRAVKHLLEIGLSIVIPEYEWGTVWRIPHPLTKAEIRDRLARLPCVFPDISLYYRLETLDEVEEDGSFEFKALPRTAPLAK